MAAGVGETAGGRSTAASAGRVAGLDGVRGLAALFVVLHHCWLMSFPGYPANSGPAWTGFLVYGHLAVAVFFVLSGFCLGVAPARHGWRLDGLGRYAVRRARRILPPYWAALVFSLVIAWIWGPQPASSSPTATSVVVYGLLLQDVLSVPTPNGAFWTIAIEVHLYLLVPLLLLMIRRTGAAAMVAAVLGVVLAIGVFAPSVSSFQTLLQFTPPFAVGFAVGLVAAGVLRSGTPRLPWHWLAPLAAVPVLGVIVAQGPVWTVGHYFWIDLAVIPAIALLLAGLATGRPAPLLRFLEWTPIRDLGSFSYSLYLIHAPIIVALARRLIQPHVTPGVPAFLVTLAIGVPTTLIVARLFAAVFELPFQRHKSSQRTASPLQAGSAILPASCPVSVEEKLDEEKNDARHDRRDARHRGGDDRVR